MRFLLASLLFAGIASAQSARALSNDSVFWRDGKPLAGGLVFSYRSGSNVPMPTFADADATVFNHNPVVLDNRGVARIFLRRGWSYRLRICDSLGLRCEIYRDNLVGQLNLEWRWSAASLAAAQVADAASSWRRTELNPLLRSGSGDFEAKGLALKATTTAGMLFIEFRLIRRHPALARSLTVLNFVAASGAAPSLPMR